MTTTASATATATAAIALENQDSLEALLRFSPSGNGHDVVGVRRDLGNVDNTPLQHVRRETEHEQSEQYNLKQQYLCDGGRTKTKSGTTIDNS